jgi:MFS family permease
MRTRTRMLAVVSTSLLLSVLVWFNYSAVLPFIIEQWELSGLRAGIIFAAFQAGYLFAIIPMGSLADRFTPRWVIGGGATVTGVASLAFALAATGFLTGTVFRFIAGLGMAGVYVPGMRFITDWYDETARGRAMGIYVGAFSLGSGLSFLVSSIVATAIDWRTAILVTSIGALFVGPIILGIGRDSSKTTARSRTHDEFDLSVIRNGPYLAAVGVYSGHNWELFGVRNWIVAYLSVTIAVSTLDAPTAIAGILTGVMIVCGGLGNAVGGWLSDRWGRQQVITVALIASGLISASIANLGWLPFPALAGLVLVYGTMLTMDSAPTSTAITELVREENVGTALSVQSFIGFTTTVVSPIVFGAVLDVSGFSAAFLTLAVGPVAALLFLLLLRSKQNKAIGKPPNTDRE